MGWAMLGILAAIAVVVGAVVILIDRKAGPIRAFLTVLAAFGGAWALNWLTRLLSHLDIAGVYLVPAVVGALAAGLLFRSISERFGGKRRV